MQKEFARNVLFTGAGFTKNFGGLLAKEMWSQISNNTKVQAHSRIRHLLLHDFDYESIYFHVMTGDYTDQEKKSINEAILLIKDLIIYAENGHLETMPHIQ